MYINDFDGMDTVKFEYAKTVEASRVEIVGRPEIEKFQDGSRNGYLIMAVILMIGAITGLIATLAI